MNGQTKYIAPSVGGGIRGAGVEPLAGGAAPTPPWFYFRTLSVNHISMTMLFTDLMPAASVLALNRDRFSQLL